MPQNPQPGSVVPLPDARRIVEQQARTLTPPPVETIDLLHAAGRVLAEQLFADRDLPPFPRATRDGYALRSQDLSTIPGKLRLIGEVRAGSPIGELTVGRGEAAEIMTGAPVPRGADAVVMVEYTRRVENGVEIQRSVAAGENVVPRGAEGRAGDVVLTTGNRVGYAQVAVAAAMGRSQVQVYQRPQVAILSTGDEIVDIAARPGPHQIRNSNSYSVSAQVRSAGGDPVAFPIAPDDAVVLHHLIEQGLALDLLLLTGGVSMGKYDLVEQVLREFGAEFFFTGALIQPGRPVVFGRAPREGGPFRYFFGLPGNPVSTMVTFELFVRPVLDALGGSTIGSLRFLQARLKREIRTKIGLTRFLPAVLSGEYGETEVELARWQGSGDIVAAARASCYVVIPPDRERIAAGEMVSVLPIRM